MEIVFSRHAKRRMALYGIAEEDVLKTIERGTKTPAGEPGRSESLDYRMADRYGYPLKVVLQEERGTRTVITVYPLKKERKKL